MNDKISQPSMQRLYLREAISDYFGKTLQNHGTTYLGVDGKSPEAQLVRFAQSSKSSTDTQRFLSMIYSVGALYDYMKAHGFQDYHYFVRLM